MFFLSSLVSCKKTKIIEPSSHQNYQLLSTVQQWYAKNPATWKSFTKFKNARGESENDTLSFYPQWQQNVAVVDNEGNYVFIIPIHRDLLVGYTDDFDFIRRLRIVVSVDGEILQANIVEVMTERNTLETIEKSVFRNLNYLEVANFSGIILEYDLNYQLQRSRFWLNGNLLRQNIEIAYEQETTSTSQRSGDCFPVYMYIKIPGECPNNGQPGHTGHFCSEPDKWVRVFVGYDCFLNSIVPSIGGIGGGAAVTEPPSNNGFLSGCCGSLGGDTGGNIGGPRGHQFSDPIEDARVLNQLNEITAGYGILQSDGSFKDAPTEKQKLELARTLDRLIKAHSAYNKMFNIFKEKNIKITWRVKQNLGEGKTRGKAQVFVNPDETQLNVISFNGISTIKNNSIMAEEMIHMLQLHKKGEVTGNYSIPDEQHVCSEYEAKAIIKMIAANGAGRKFDTDSFFDSKEKYRDSNPNRYNGILAFEKAFDGFLEQYRGSNFSLPKSRNQMNWQLFMNLLDDFNRYGPAEYNFPANYNANGWEWAIMFELFNY
ncbi:MAG: hypothetical protein NZ516_09910 [Raineya sp.]|nr:hypothetical protein [Raineya sp.]